MSSPTEPTPPSEPLPPHLKALLELNREAEGGSSVWPSAHWGDYWMFWAVALLYGSVAWFSRDQAPLFFGMLFLVVILHEIGERRTERRAQRRLQLLLTVIRGLERREDVAPRS